jgi:hypothetical protein
MKIEGPITQHTKIEHGINKICELEISRMNVFANEFMRLRSMFPEWSALKEFLVTEASLRVIESEDAPGLAIVRYVKDKSKMDCKTINMSFFRSVIVNTLTNTVVCVAPFKAEAGLPPLDTEFSQVQDFVDGCMMQVFMTKDGVMHLATRTQIGAKNSFYSAKSFGELFTEALAATPLRTMDSLKEALTERLNSLEGSTSVFASFVIQHPEHRIVMKYRSPDLNMVHFGYTQEDGSLTVKEDSSLWSPPFRRLQVTMYPISETDAKTFTNVEEIHALVRRTSVSAGFCWQGLVFKTADGKRWKVRSKSYLLLRGLRGGEALAVERFLRLRKEGKVVEYLKHYGEEREAFWELETALRTKTTEVLKAYEDVNKTRVKTFADLSPAYKPGVFMLHNYYLTHLRPENKGSIRLNDAIRIVNAMKPFEQRRLLEA